MQENVEEMTKGSHHGSCRKPEMKPMVKVKFKAKQREYKRLSAQEIHSLVSEVLQERFPLAMEGRAYEAQDIWDVLIAAAVERMTIEGATRAVRHSFLLVRHPGPRRAALTCGASYWTAWYSLRLAWVYAG